MDFLYVCQEIYIGDLKILANYSDKGAPLPLIAKPHSVHGRLTSLKIAGHPLFSDDWL